jgi:hypothetical protein
VAADNLPVDFKPFEYLADTVVIVDEELKVVYLNNSAVDFYNMQKRTFWVENNENSSVRSG